MWDLYGMAGRAVAGGKEVRGTLRWVGDVVDMIWAIKVDSVPAPVASISASFSAAGVRGNSYVG